MSAIRARALALLACGVVVSAAAPTTALAVTEVHLERSDSFGRYDAFLGSSWFVVATGGPGRNFVRAARVGGLVQISDSAGCVQPGEGCWDAGAAAVACPAHPGIVLLAELGAGDDDVAVTGDLPLQASLGSGDDSAAAGDGNSSIFGGPGADRLVGGSGVDVIGGGSGSDTIEGGDDDDDLRGDAGRSGGDPQPGAGDGDRIDGGPGDDRIDGADGNDVLNGGDGDDGLVDAIANGADRLDGGPGADLLDYAGGTRRVIVDLRRGAAQGGDRLTAIDGVRAQSTAGATLTGDDGPNVLGGTAGRDRIDGRGGDDQLLVGDVAPGGTDGRDDLRGGPGDDLLEVRPGVADLLACDRGDDAVGFSPQRTGDAEGTPRTVPLATRCESVRTEPDPNDDNDAEWAVIPRVTRTRSPSALVRCLTLCKDDGLRLAVARDSPSGGRLASASAVSGTGAQRLRLRTRASARRVLARARTVRLALHKLDRDSRGIFRLRWRPR